MCTDAPFVERLLTVSSIFASMIFLCYHTASIGEGLAVPAFLREYGERARVASDA
jgi:hypothetical protein